MYLMYVDESGDSGINSSPTKYFVLTAIVFHELRWSRVLHNFTEFRRELKKTKGLKLREEIHASHFINKPGRLSRIKRNDRIDILKKCIQWANLQSDLNVFSIVVNKSGKKSDIFEIAWNTLLTRFENTIRHKNFAGPQNADERGIVLSDNTEGKKLRILLRKMRHFNAIPNKTDLYDGGYRNINLQYVIEDPVLRDSSISYLHQLCDVIAYFARQKYEPNAYMRKKGAINYYDRLNNIICKKVTANNNLGIVEL